MKILKGKKKVRRLRRSGIAFLIILLGVLLSAWNTGTNLLYIVVGGLVSFLLLSYFIPGRSLSRLTMKREAPSAVHRGETFLVAVRIENHKRIVPSLSLRLESALDSENPLAYLLRIPSRRAAALNVQVVFDKRGVYPLPDFDLVCSYPFGLIEQRRRYSDDWQIVVYPKVRNVRTSVLDQASGTRHMSQKPTPDGDEFYGLREYVPGDDLRLVAWRVSARLGTWIVREMARENSRFVTFVLDTRRPADVEGFDDLFEEVVELVASLSITLLKRQYNVSVVAPENAVDPGEGSGQERKVLEMLARVNPVAPAEFPNFDQEVLRIEGERAVMLYFSADPRTWGRGAGESMRAVDPREVLHA